MGNNNHQYLPQLLTPCPRWINFDADSPFAIKIYIGGINAVSGESARETEVTMKRRLILMQEKKNIQDYVVAPHQLWLDGIATGSGTVRQFVATPLGSGYSVEAQVTGADTIGGMQIEVTPVRPTPIVEAWYEPRPVRSVPEDGSFQVDVRTLTGKTVTLVVDPWTTIDWVKVLIEDEEGIPRLEQRLILAGRQLQDGQYLAFCKPNVTDI